MSNRKRKLPKKYSTIFWGLVLILAAVVLILDNVGVDLGPGINLWRVIGGVLLLAWFVMELVNRRFCDVVFPLAFLLILFRDPIVARFELDPEKFPKIWIIIVAAALITTGLHVIFDRKKTIVIDDENSGDGEKKIGKEGVHIDAAELSGYTIKNHMGAFDLYVTNPESYPGSGVLTISDNLGVVTLHLPNDWNVLTQCNDNLGSVSVPEHEYSGDKSITLHIHNNLGKVAVEFE